MTAAGSLGDVRESQLKSAGINITKHNVSANILVCILMRDINYSLFFLATPAIAIIAAKPASPNVGITEPPQPLLSSAGAVVVTDGVAVSDSEAVVVSDGTVVEVSLGTVVVSTGAAVVVSAGTADVVSAVVSAGVDGRTLLTGMDGAAPVPVQTIRSSSASFTLSEVIMPIPYASVHPQRAYASGPYSETFISLLALTPSSGVI